MRRGRGEGLEREEADSDGDLLAVAGHNIHQRQSEEQAGTLEEEDIETALEVLVEGLFHGLFHFRHLKNDRVN